ncbi:MAG: OpgC domain-containing protein [Dehalococcoidia bacterium]
MKDLYLKAAHWLHEHIVEREEKWHYEGGKRDLRLDLLRGFAAFAMITDHIGGADSYLYSITGGDRFVVSAAEVYVFISGAVMGIVYHNVFTRQGIGATLMKAAHRAWQLYVITIVLTLSFAAIGAAWDLWWRPDTSGGIATYVLEVLTLHRTMYLTDIPMMYTILLLAAGPVLLLLAQGYTRIALAGSFAVWLLWQISPSSAEVPWHIEGNTVFNIAAWQVLFVAGLAIGWHRAKLETLFSHLARPVVFVSLATVSVAIVALYVAQLTVLDEIKQNSTAVSLFFDKANVPAGRLLTFGLLMTFAFVLTTLFWEPIKRLTGWLLMPFGENSLKAYSLHVFVVALVAKFGPEVLGGRVDLVESRTALQILGVAAIWLLIVLQPEAISLLKQCQARVGQHRFFSHVSTQPGGSAPS